mmetsp:Transcript_7163/g.13718  ORF Transcript_7163/g.13718 Transcript_7163/m.13718 type:complete len:202 (+) Transcript_7163:253-858(+)
MQPKQKRLCLKPIATLVSLVASPCYLVHCCSVKLLTDSTHVKPHHIDLSGHPVYVESCAVDVRGLAADETIVGRESTLHFPQSSFNLRTKMPPYYCPQIFACTCHGSPVACAHLPSVVGEHIQACESEDPSTCHPCPVKGGGSDERSQSQCPHFQSTSLHQSQIYLFLEIFGCLSSREGLVSLRSNALEVRYRRLSGSVNL